MSPSPVTVGIAVDPARAAVYEQGWQSWSPTAAYRLDERPLRPVSEARRIGGYRPDRIAPPGTFSGEGLLAVDTGTGEGVHVLAALSPSGSIPSIRAAVSGSRVLVSASQPVQHLVVAEAGGLQAALARWADGFVAAHRNGPLRPPPTVWCSWYHYFSGITQADVEENLAAIDDLGLEVGVVQIDDGWQREIGDWLSPSARFSSLAGLVDTIRATGRRAGIWVAPFLLGARAGTLREHPGWAVGGADPGEGWDQRLAALDVTSPGAEGYLQEVFGTLAALGIDYFKLDFLYAGAMEGRRADPSVAAVDAYRRGLTVIREAAGPQAFLLACGAPQLPSVGLVDGMRVGPDIASHVEPRDGDMSQPSQRAATLTARSRAWAQGRFWINDGDCLIAAPQVERRADWAEVVERFSGLRASSDRLLALDGWGLETTRRLLRPGIVGPFVP